MKQSTLILSAALVAALGGAGWLFSANNRLRSELEATAVPGDYPAKRQTGTAPAPVGASAAVAAQAGKSAERPPAPAPAVFRSGGSPAGRSGAPAPVAKSSPLRITENGDGTFTVSDSSARWQHKVTTDELRAFRQELDSTMQSAVTKLPGGPSWSPGQAAGPPNTAEHGDYSTAWASQNPDGGREWLQLKYPKSVEISEITIHETYNPGALAKVSAIMPDGSERVIWEGTENAEQGVIERAVKVPPGIRSDQIRVELDTARVPGWNEIDAVELVGRDGSRQWASESTASSYYGQSRNAAYHEQMQVYFTLDQALPEATSLPRVESPPDAASLPAARSK